MRLRVQLLVPAAGPEGVPVGLSLEPPRPGVRVTACRPALLGVSLLWSSAAHGPARLAPSLVPQLHGVLIRV